MIFTGSRDWPEGDPFWIDVVVSGLLAQGMTQASIGDCRTGVDRLVRERLVQSVGPRNIRVFRAHWKTCLPNHPTVPCRHRPSWGGRCPAAGPRRNQEMVDAGGDRCVALSNGPIEDSRGTLDCAVRAELAKIPVTTIEREPVL